MPRLKACTTAWLFIYCFLNAVPFFIFCVWVFCMYICVRMLDPLELELQTGVSCHVGAGNWTWILWQEKPVLLTAEPSLQDVAYFKETLGTIGSAWWWQDLETLEWRQHITTSTMAWDYLSLTYFPRHNLWFVCQKRTSDSLDKYWNIGGFCIEPLWYHCCLCYTFHL